MIRSTMCLSGELCTGGEQNVADRAGGDPASAKQALWLNMALNSELILGFAYTSHFLPPCLSSPPGPTTRRRGAAARTPPPSSKRWKSLQRFLLLLLLLLPPTLLSACAACPLPSPPNPEMSGTVQSLPSPAASSPLAPFCCRPAGRCKHQARRLHPHHHFTN
jgi:hypothetical protein